ncbi:MAG: transposase [Deltaproteobacteria bacterium]|nr:transposase [Deltaproteobacteria bacterium]
MVRLFAKMIWRCIIGDTAREASKAWHRDKDRMRLKWRCPLIATKESDDISTCPFSQQCSKSSYGRVVYTYPKTNHRLFTVIPRGSELFKKHYKHRSCAERSIKRQKYDFGLNQTRTASRERWFLRVMLAAMAQHLAAWWMIQEGKQEIPKAA